MTGGSNDTKRKRLFGSGSLICSLFLLSCEALAQIQSPGISADELVRRTAAHELAAANADGCYQYHFEEHTARGSETRDVLESRSWSVDRLVLKNARPLTAAEQRREEQRLQCLVANPTRLQVFEKEQSSRKKCLQTMIAAFPQAFSCQYDGEEGTFPPGLIRLKFHPNPRFVGRSWELRLLQGMEGILLIEADDARLVRMEATFFRDVEFGGGFLGRIDRGGSFEFEQQTIGGDRRAITTLALHFNKHVLLAKTRVDSVIHASGFRCLPADMTLQQGLKRFLKQRQMTVASQDAGKSQ